MQWALVSSATRRRNSISAAADRARAEVYVVIGPAPHTRQPVENGLGTADQIAGDAATNGLTLVIHGWTCLVLM
jgi:hypothetical protein